MQKLSEQVQRLSLTSLHPVLDIGYIMTSSRRDGVVLVVRVVF